MFLSRLTPYKDESLLSFMSRNARENGISLQKFWGHIKPKEFKKVTASELNLIETTPTSSINLEKLMEITGISKESLLSMTFYYAHRKFSHRDNMGLSRFIKGLVRKVAHFCPSCLEQGNYIRLHWKIAGIDVCLKHQMYLLQACSTCGCPFPLIQTKSPCSECNSSIDRKVVTPVTDPTVLVQQEWLKNAWDQLLGNHTVILSPQEVGQKIIYILNEQNSIVDMGALEHSCQKRGFSFERLLPYVRDTLSQQGRIHLSDLLRLLYQYKLEINTFLSLNVPSKFLKNFHSKNEQQVTVKCLAPWCISYNKSESLSKTGTHYNRLKSGELKKHYYFCQDCGCTYYLDEHNQQNEKEGFIEGYSYLNSNDISIYNLVRNTTMSLSKCRRIIAYFKTRISIEKSHIDLVLLNELETAIDQNIGLMKIQSWPCWESLDHFLIYRYHINVLRRKANTKKIGREKVDYPMKMKSLYQIVKTLLDNDVIITQNKVASMLEISSVTLRNWKDGYKYITDMKEIQREKLQSQRVSKWYALIEEYIENRYRGGRIYTKDIYNYLGVKQSYLKSVAPEVTAYISMLKDTYNGQLNNNLTTN
ncbi:TniQ family protein [Paenibacillus sp. Dod16]|uniref:TniQ family protein n=1 Tax=Paenibacillus sp. Dod16 TaxID=3416392 RepID=UPI003CF61B0C